jgi:hypothetical protein
VIEAPSGSHSVHFYEPNLFPAKHIADFLRKGISEDEGIVVLAPKDHTTQIERDIESLGLHVRSLRSAGLWSVVNTDTLLRALLSGISVARLIANAIEPTFQMTREKSPTGRIRIYGEFVDVVLKLGMPDACLELERYARQVSSENAAHIYCGYSADSFPEAGHAKQFTKVCLLHNLIHTNLNDHNDWRYRMAQGISKAGCDPKES